MRLQADLLLAAFRAMASYAVLTPCGVLDWRPCAGFLAARSAEGVQRGRGHQQPPRTRARSRRSARPPAAPTRRPGCGCSCTRSRRSRGTATSRLVPVELQRLQDRGHVPGLRLRRSDKSSISVHFVVGELGGHGHARGQLDGLLAAGGTTSRGAAWRGCGRRRGGCRCAASRPGRCPCPSADTSSSSCRPLRERLFVLTEPCRRLVWYMTTASCSNCLLMRGANSAGSISYVPTSAPVRS